MTIIISCNAQNNDALLFNQITINAFSLQQTENSLITILGNPETIENYSNEVDGENWQDYKYSGNSFYFFNNKLVDFELKNDMFYFYNPMIKVGNHISEINSVFPNSYLNKGIVSDIGFITIDINMPDGTISDTFIEINYNKISNIITSIHFGEK